MAVYVCDRVMGWVGAHAICVVDVSFLCVCVNVCVRVCWGVERDWASADVIIRHWNSENSWEG